jgi:hypothetical protein
MSKLFVDDIVEKTSGHGVVIPGHILQVVTKTHGVNQVVSGTTSTEYTGIATTITPKVTGSKIYVIVNLSLGNNYNGADWYETRLYRDSTSNQIGNRQDIYFNERYEMIGPKLMHNIVDPLATTAGTSRTYKIYGKGSVGSANLQFNWSSNNTESSMTLMEIAQ